jgi:hypothetical protein
MARLICFVLATIFIAAIPNLSHAQYYFVHTYEPIMPIREDSPAELYLKSINLNTHSIEQSIRLNTTGYFLPKTPTILSNNNHQYLISVSVSQEMGATVFYYLFRFRNNQLSLLRDGSFPGVRLDAWEQYQGEEGFRFGLSGDSNRTVILPSGLYGLDNNLNFRFLRGVDMSEEPGLIENIGSFEYVIKVPFDTANQLYYTIHKDSQWWLVKLNEELNAVVDSTQLRFSGGAATLFAYHPDRAKFYCLHVNYEMHTGNVDSDSVYKRREDYYINPDVIIYDPQTLEILEQHSVTDYPEGEYPGKDNGLADVVGDFIIYYFFDKEEYYRYDPAMLLIFDTRTNETTWLRVGWR